MLNKEVGFLLVKQIIKSYQEGQRLKIEDALVLIEKGDFLEVARLAQLEARKRHGNIVTFVIDRNINYTNICNVGCKFCAFYRRQEDKTAYVLSIPEILTKVEEAVDLGATQIMLQGGLNDNLDFTYYLDMIRSIKNKYDITVHSFSPPEIYHMAEITSLSITGVLKKLKEAGLDSLPGGGAEILVDRVRKYISPRKISASQWLGVMEAAHNLGLKSTATMMIGSMETWIERLEHLDKLRVLQDKTHGFRAFISWTYQPGNTELGGKKISSYEYLKFLAVSRLFLDNFDHVQGSWVTQGPVIGQLTLAFGGNDLGSIMLEENVVKAAGVNFQMKVQQMVDLIKSAGCKPAQRDTQYNILRFFE